MKADAPVSYPFWLIVFATGSGTLAVHVFVPALPVIAADFGVGAASAQLVISAYMFALAVGHLVYGPLSDRFGRRPVMIAGLVLYALAGLAAAAAPDFGSLIVARVLQAFGGCAGLTLGRAVIQDTAKGPEAVSRLAAVNNVLLISPAVAPMLGQWLTMVFDWRAVPLALSAGGWLVAVGTVLWLRETATTRVYNARALVAGYFELLRRPRFLAYVAGGALTTTPQFALLTASPFIVTGTLGRPAHEVGVIYICFIAGLMSGGFASRQLVRRVGFNRLIAAGSTLGLLMAGCLLAQGLTETLTLPGFILAGYLFTACVGMLSPLTLTRAVSEGGTLVGSATGLFGCAQMVTASVSIVIGGLGGSVLVSTAAVLCVASLLGIASLTYAMLSSRNSENS
ncbi:MAG: multidrug effflux MFS transporter [Rhizobiaceae bacterium]|nr:multidrug effflux MFS transporter [Rhizobiaceae bacterium]